MKCVRCMYRIFNATWICPDEEGHNYSNGIVGVNVTCKCIAIELTLFPTEEFSSTNYGNPDQSPPLPPRLKKGDGMVKATSLAAHPQSDVNVAAVQMMPPILSPIGESSSIIAGT